MGGPELVRQALALCPAVKVLCMSGYAEGLLRDPSLRARGIRLIEKPFDAGILLAAIQDALGGKAPGVASPTIP
jgi:DNA-binding NtrC family response regulator